MKCLAGTQGPKIRVNAVLPGLLLTEWVSKGIKMAYQGTVLTLMQGQNFTPEQVQAVKDKSLLKMEVCLLNLYSHTRIDCM